MVFDFRFAHDHKQELKYAEKGLGFLRNAAVLTSFLMNVEGGGDFVGSKNDDEAFFI